MAVRAGSGFCAANGVKNVFVLGVDALQVIKPTLGGAACRVDAALGTPVYSSAVFNFIPKTAMDFYHAVAADDMATQHHLRKDFFTPCLAIRNKNPGHAVSIVKAGATLVGHGAGPVRPPLTDLKPAEMEALAVLLNSLGPQ